LKQKLHLSVTDLVVDGKMSL